MRCPHCRGEIPGGSRFCGVCGADVTVPPTAATSRQRPSAAMEGASASLFELPVSKGARLARVFVVLALDVLLAGAGVAMILAYVDARKAAAGEVPAAPDAGVQVEVAALPPQVVAVADEQQPPPESNSAGEEATPAERTREPRRRPSAREPEPEPARTAEPDRRDPEPVRGSEPGPSGAGQLEEPSGDREPGDGGESDTDEPAAGGEPGPSADAGADDPDDVERLAARISLLVDRHQAQLQRCYERAAKVTTPAEPLEGRVEVRFQVTPEGRAQDVRVHANDTGSRGLGDCLSGLVESWSFPAGAREPTEFLWPFVFRAPQ